MEKFTWQDKRWLKYISRDNWQSGSELQEQIEALEMVEMMFEYKEISKETIAAKKKELAQAQQKMRAANQEQKPGTSYQQGQKNKRREQLMKKRKARGADPKKAYHSKATTGYYD